SICLFFFKQKTAYEIFTYVCSSDLAARADPDCRRRSASRRGAALRRQARRGRCAYPRCATRQGRLVRRRLARNRRLPRTFAGACARHAPSHLEHDESDMPTYASSYSLIAVVALVLALQGCRDAASQADTGAPPAPP